ncbi:MAG: substrate-binding domain-containing protein [Pseudomonadales bacterium]
MHISLSLRWQVEAKENREIEQNLFLLLHAVRRDRSLKKASTVLGFSYRYAWGLVKGWEQTFNTPLMILERGRGARLSPLGEKLLAFEQQAIDKMKPELTHLVDEINNELALELGSVNHDRLRMFASHGIVVAEFIDLLSQQPALDVAVETRGSLDALRLLSSGQCEVAGFHFPLEKIKAELAPLYRTWLDPKRHTLLLLATREQGLMTDKANIKNIRNISDLNKRSVRFVNRQRGSGTRTIFDHLLEIDDVSSRDIAGYGHEEFTHLAVAAMIASGTVDAGLGIKAAAEKFGLNFIPLLSEAYVLAVAHDESSNHVARLKALLKSKQFHERVVDVPGYDTSSTGQVLDFDDLFAD